MSRKWNDLVVVAIATLAAMGLSQVPGINIVVRSVVLAPLVLIWPGYGLVAAIFGPGTLRTSERLLMIAAFSLAMTGLGGFVLNSMSSGMNRDAWVLWLGAVTLVTTGFAALRRVRSEQAIVEPRTWKVQGRYALMLALAVVVAGGAFGVSQAAARRQQATAFTQLWMVPHNSQGASLDLGVRNVENQPMQYRLTVAVGGKVVQEWARIELNPEQAWTSSYVLPAVATPANVEAVLYRLDTPQTPYRHVLIRGEGAGK